jgi:hypothetical protein
VGTPRTPRQREDDALEMLVLLLRPERAQVWRGPDEIPGRTLMRDGTWLI